MHRLALSIFFAYFLTNKSIIYRKSVFLFAYFIGKVWFVFGMWLVFSTFDI